MSTAIYCATSPQSSLKLNYVSGEKVPNMRLTNVLKTPWNFCLFHLFI